LYSGRHRRPPRYTPGATKGPGSHRRRFPLQSQYVHDPASRKTSGQCINQELNIEVRAHQLTHEDF
jgi:hypothetical protein